VVLLPVVVGLPCGCSSKSAGPSVGRQGRRDLLARLGDPQELLNVDVLRCTVETPHLLLVIGVVAQTPMAEYIVEYILDYEADLAAAVAIPIDVVPLVLDSFDYALNLDLELDDDGHLLVTLLDRVVHSILQHSYVMLYCSDVSNVPNL
jgi:hypothetical protein